MRALVLIHYPSFCFFESRQALSPESVGALSKICAQKGVTIYSLMSAAIVGTFALMSRRGKKLNLAVGNAVELLNFTKYDRERITYVGSSSGSISGFFTAVGGSAGDLWTRAVDMAKHMNTHIQEGRYVDSTELMMEGGWFYRHKTLNRAAGHLNALSISISYLGDIPDLTEGTPWEVDHITWGMNYNSMPANVTVLLGKAPNGELIAQFYSNNSLITREELREFSTIFKGLLLDVISKNGL